MVTVGYVLIIFVGAVSYFITVPINDEAKTWREGLQKIAEVYVIPEWCAWWTGYYVIVLGHHMELIWAYGDMLILSSSLVMLYQLQRFNLIVTAAYRSANNGNIHPRDVENLRIFHWKISKSVKMTNKMLSILTLAVFICNILYLFSRVFNGLENDLTNPNLFINFEAIYAFSYLIIRIFSTVIMATKFSSETTKSLRVLAIARSAGETEYLLMDRFCAQLLSSNLAISGCGYFYLNRGFITTLVSALLTYEVVILQFSVAARAKVTPNSTADPLIEMQL